MEISSGPVDLDELVRAGRAARARAEDLESRARAERDRLAGIIQALLDLGTPKRAAARLLDYASDNSVRVKTARQG
jgi:septal ring factor EnvC (AmiA/AmiB activator)